MTSKPIKDLEKINEMKNILKEKNMNIYVLYMFALNTGLKLMEILTLKIDDVIEDNEDETIITDTIIIDNEKKSTLKEVKLNNSIKSILKDYINDNHLKKDDYLIKGKISHIDRTWAYKVLKSAASEVGIKNFSTTTIQKTWGYWTYTKTKNISIVMKRFNHKSKKYCLNFIDIKEEIKNYTIEFK